MKGQVMLITVLVLSGTILGATAIAGLLMLYQIRQSTDIVNSTKAIYAADSGIEWQLYKFFKAPDPDAQKCKTCAESDFACPPPEFQNDFSLKTTFETICSVQTVNEKPVVNVKSTGLSGNSARAFEIILQ